MSRKIPQVKTFGRRPPALRPFVPPQRRTLGLPDDDLTILSTYRRRMDVYDDYDRYNLCKKWLEINSDQPMDDLSKAWLLLHRYARISRNVNYARACPYDPEVANLLENSRRLLLRNNIGLPV